MKSIICEASSVAKAIEQCWQKAGMPQNFSVKILEKEERNFLGIAKKLAKIAIFFDEKQIQQNQDFQKKRPDNRYSEKPIIKQNNYEKTKYDTEKSFKENILELQNSIKTQPRDIKNQSRDIRQPINKVDNLDRFPKKQQPDQSQKITPRSFVEKNELIKKEEEEQKIVWTNEMVDMCSKWISDMTKKIGLPDAKFSVSTSNGNILFKFDKPLFENRNMQRDLFRNLSFLLLQTLKCKFKKHFKNIRINFACQ